MRVQRLRLEQFVILAIGGGLTLAVLLADLQSAAFFAIASVAMLVITANYFRWRQSLDMAMLVIAGMIVFAYFVRYLVIIQSAELLYFLVPTVARPALYSAPVLTASLMYVTSGFLAFATAATVLRLGQVRWPRYATAPPRLRIPVSVLLIAAIGSLILIDVLMVKFGIGTQGKFVESPLPFKLTGAIVYAKRIIIPCLCALCIYWAQLEGRPLLARLAAAVLLISGALDMVIFASRGALLTQVLLVALVWLMAGFKITKGDLLLLVAVVGGALFAVPIVTLIRLYDISLQIVSVAQVYVGLIFVLLRITGIDQFVIILDLSMPLPFERLWEVLTSERGVAGYYTLELLGLDETLPQTFAPSGAGWLYLVGGTLGVVLGCIVMAFFLVGAWKAIDALLPCFGDVARAVVVMQLIVMITDGVMGLAMTAMWVGLATLWLAEIVLPIRVTHSPVARANIHPA